MRPVALLLLCCACTPSDPSSSSKSSPAADSAGPVRTGGTEGTDGTDGTNSAAPATWRSSLYPADWTPGFSTADGSLRDFSHAGYRGGGVALPQPDPAAAVSVVDHGADPTGTADSTAAIQAAIEAAPETGLHLVHLPAGTYRVDGTLRVERSQTVLLGDGSDLTTLVFTKDEGLDYGAHLRFLGRPEGSLPTPLAVDLVPHSTVVELAENPGYEAGDEVWIGIEITDDFIAEHEMEGFWSFSAGQWRPFFRRTVVEVGETEAGTALHLDVSLPYPLRVRDGLRVEKVDGYLEEVGLQGLALTNAVSWDAAWAGSQVHAVALEGVKDGWVADLVSVAGAGTGIDGAPSEHHLQSSGLLVKNSRRVTVADSHLGHSQHRGEGGNGYLFEVRVSNEVLIRDSTAVAGRHNFVQNWDFGTSDLVFLRVESHGGEAFTSATDPAGIPACSETHHALAIGVLLDDSVVTDCWSTVNRREYSSGAGHTATESVVWNVRGEGILSSMQHGRGYVIGVSGFNVRTTVTDAYDSEGTAPDDLVEGLEAAETLEPRSLYEDQLARRLGG
jgi:hypothetical protein